MMKKIISYLFVLLVFAFLFWQIFWNRSTILSFQWRFSFSDVFLVIMFLLPIFIVNSFAWHLLTRALGAHISYSSNLKIWMFSNFARYLPGGIWQYPGRVLLLSREGVSKSFGATCLVLEALFVVFVSLSIVLLVFISGRLNLPFEDVRFLFLLFLFLLFLFVVISSERFMTGAARLLVSMTGRGKYIGNIRLPLRWVPILVLFFFLEFLLPGIVLFMLAGGVIPATLDLLPVFVGIYAASWLAGYITFFAPAGIGVREASIAGLLSFIMPFSVGVVIAVAFRLLLFVSEVLILAPLLLYYGGKKSS